jgi:dTDP-glucose 4,6-dehydratase
MQRVLVTGGAGFIGSNLVRYLLERNPEVSITVLDKLTYAGNLDNLRGLESNPRLRFVQGDIRDATLVASLMADVDGVVNLAAETHVDRSLMDPSVFVTTNVFGIYTLLEAAQRHHISRFVHLSTDEVYGDNHAGRPSRETDPLHPTSPYAASKASADMFCVAYFLNYGVSVIIARPGNNLGPHQHVEKVIPLFTTNALRGEPLPLYGDGRAVSRRGGRRYNG